MTAAQQRPQVYSISEVSRILGVSRAAVRRALALGQLPSFHLGSKTLVPRHAVDALVQGGEGRDTGK